MFLYNLKDSCELISFLLGTNVNYLCCKGLIPAMQEVMLEVHHRFCV